MSEEFITISALLTQEQIDFLDQVARDKGIRGRQVPLRWAIDAYRRLYSPDRSIFQIDRDAEQPTERDAA